MSVLQKQSSGMKDSKSDSSVRKVKKARHPSYIQMIEKAIRTLKNPHGSSRQKIFKYILENYNSGSDKKLSKFRLNKSIKQLVKSRRLLSNTQGYSGSFRLNPSKSTGKKKKRPAKSNISLFKKVATRLSVRQRAAATASAVNRKPPYHSTRNIPKFEGSKHKKYDNAKAEETAKIEAVQKWHSNFTKKHSKTTLPTKNGNNNIPSLNSDNNAEPIGDCLNTEPLSVESGSNFAATFDNNYLNLDSFVIDSYHVTEKQKPCFKTESTGNDLIDVIHQHHFLSKTDSRQNVHFGFEVSNCLDKLDLFQQRIIKMKIMQLLYDIEFENTTEKEEVGERCAKLFSSGSHFESNLSESKLTDNKSSLSEKEIILEEESGSQIESGLSENKLVNTSLVYGNNAIEEEGDQSEVNASSPTPSRSELASTENESESRPPSANSSRSETVSPKEIKPSDSRSSTPSAVSQRGSVSKEHSVDEAYSTPSESGEVTLKQKKKQNGDTVTSPSSENESTSAEDEPDVDDDDESYKPSSADDDDDQSYKPSNASQSAAAEESVNTSVV